MFYFLPYHSRIDKLTYIKFNILTVYSASYNLFVFLFVLYCFCLKFAFLNHKINILYLCSLWIKSQHMLTLITDLLIRLFDVCFCDSYHSLIGKLEIWILQHNCFGSSTTSSALQWNVHFAVMAHSWLFRKLSFWKIRKPLWLRQYNWIVLVSTWRWKA